MQAMSMPTTTKPVSRNAADGGFRHASATPVTSGEPTLAGSRDLPELLPAVGTPNGVLNGGAELRIGGRTILVDPGIPSLGFTLFGENGFAVGREAFVSDAELTKTLLHETYRLEFSRLLREFRVSLLQPKPMLRSLLRTALLRLSSNDFVNDQEVDRGGEDPDS